MGNIHKCNPWKGLESYTYKDAEKFYGRDRELREIANVIKSNAFSTLYGISGAGKTSIINAGLIPLLDKQSFLPLYIRLDHNSGHEPYDIQIIKFVTNALVAVGAEAECFVHQKINSELDRLWLYFHTHRFWSSDNHQLIPVIFIDQFEEIFTKNDKSEDIWAFFEMIDSLQYSTPTERILQAMESADQFLLFGEGQNFRMIFSMREDFLARLEDYSFNIPALRKNRIGLKPLNGLQALEVILNPQPDMVTRQVALHIISKIVGRKIADNERRLEATMVDTSMLSLFCTELYNYAISDKKGIITLDLVNLYGDNILELFYDRNMQQLPKETYIYLENELLTPSGFRNSVALDTLKDKGVHTEQLDVLAENRIIRIEEVNHNMRVEFTHDVLCKIAKKRRGERDKLAKLKDEKAALKAFTIDNVLIFATFALFAIGTFYSGLGGGLVLALFSFPVLSILYAVIAGRSIADKNLSKLLWGIIWACGLVFIMALGMVVIEENFSNVRISSHIRMPFLLFPPITLVLLPYFYLIRITLQNRIKMFDNDKNFILFCTIFSVIQSVLLGLFLNVSKGGGFYLGHSKYGLFLLLPYLLLAFFPIYSLYKNIQEKQTKAFSVYMMIYSVSLLLSIVLLGLMATDTIELSEHNLDASLISLLVIWGVICALCVFYTIQYSKSAKQQSFTDYYKNVLSFQVFTKYKTFRRRLVSIITCLIIFVSSFAATRYWDILPFFTLPLVSILTLNMACTELKMISSKSAFSLKILIPIVLLSELIVVSQYMIGELKMFVAYASAIVITIHTFVYLIKKENIRKRYTFGLRALAFSLVLGWILPVLSLGYDVYNTSLSPVRRVWNGTVCSNCNARLYFITVENEHGEKGLMDYSEIIVQPHFDKINISIDQEIFDITYPIRSLFCRGLDVRHKTEWDELSLVVKNRYHMIERLDESYFLTFNNKYGRACNQIFMKSFISAGTHPPYIKCLSTLNTNISADERRNLIIKKIVSHWQKYHNEYTSQDLFENKSYPFSQYDSYNDSIFKKCYNDTTLKYLLTSSDSLHFDTIRSVSVDLDYLFIYDESAELKTVMLDSLWDKLSKKDGTEFELQTQIDKAYLYLCAGDLEKALSIIKNVVESSESYDALSIFLLTLHQRNENLSSMSTPIERYEKKVFKIDKGRLQENLFEKIRRLKSYGLIFDYNQIFTNIDLLLDHKHFRLIEGQELDKIEFYVNNVNL